MNQNMNEDLMWERLKDVQRESEIGGLARTGFLPATLRLARLVSARAWLLAGLAARRAPRRHSAARIEASRAARDKAA